MNSPFARLAIATPESLRERRGLKWNKYPTAIGAWVAESDLGTAPSVKRAIQSAVDQELLAYTPDATVSSLASACSGFLSQRYGWEVDPTHIDPLPDALKGLELAIQAFIPAGASVIVPTPAYMPFLWVPQLLARDVMQVPAIRDPDGWRMDLGGIEDAFKAGGRLLVLCNPHNPTGRAYSLEELRSLSEIVERYDGIVFSDEVHGPITFGTVKHIPYATVSPIAADHSFTVVSASKAWNVPGLKCAQVIIESPRLRALWEPLAVLFGHGASTIGIIANIAAYDAGIAWLDESTSYLETNRGALIHALDSLLPEVSVVPPAATYMAWIDCSGLKIDGSPAVFFLDKAKVAVVDGAACGVGYSDFIRFNFAMPKPLLTRAVEQMATAIANR